MVLFRSLSLFPLRGSHLVLYYHQVGQKGAEFYPGGISSEDFLKVVQGFLELGYRFCSLSEAYQKAGSDRRLTISLSSDDGLACNHIAVLPTIQKYNIPLTLFMIGKCLDNKAMAWNHKLIQIRKNSDEEGLQAALANLDSSFLFAQEGNLGQRLFSVADYQKDELTDLLWERFCPETQGEYLMRTQPFLSTGQMRDLEDAGAEFALHSETHADFSRLSYPQMLGELQRNQANLAQYIRHPAPFFAFPYGRQCSPSLIPKLCRDLKLQTTLGLRFRICDNRRQNALWQRISMENAPVLSYKQLLLRPVARFFAKGSLSKRSR